MHRVRTESRQMIQIKCPRISSEWFFTSDKVQEINEFLDQASMTEEEKDDEED